MTRPLAWLPCARQLPPTTTLILRTLGASRRQRRLAQLPIVTMQPVHQELLPAGGQKVCPEQLHSVCAAGYRSHSLRSCLPGNCVGPCPAARAALLVPLSMPPRSALTYRTDKHARQ